MWLFFSNMSFIGTSYGPYITNRVSSSAKEDTESKTWLNHLLAGKWGI